MITRKIVEEEKKLEKWRIWQHKLDSLVDRLSRRLERVKAGGKPKDRKSLHEKKDEAQVITLHLIYSLQYKGSLGYMGLPYHWQLHCYIRMLFNSHLFICIYRIVKKRSKNLSQ